MFCNFFISGGCYSLQRLSYRQLYPSLKFFEYLYMICNFVFSSISSSLVLQDKTKSEYEVRIQALNMQLAMANERITLLEQDTRSAKYGQQQAESRLNSELSEKRTLQSRNQEIMAVHFYIFL